MSAGTVNDRHYHWNPETIDDNCPPDDQLRAEFDADPLHKSHLIEFERYREWRRHGGGMIEFEDWNGTYFSNDGQYVTPPDASNLAAALTRALDDRLSRMPRLVAIIRQEERRFRQELKGIRPHRRFVNVIPFDRVQRQSEDDFTIDYEWMAIRVAELRDTAAAGGFDIR